MENQAQSSQQSVPAGQPANVRFGVYSQPAPVSGKTVGEVRQQFAKIWGISNDAVAYKGKDKLDENYVIQPGDNLEFHRRSGEKG
jgi:hypothetical protein